MKLHDPNRPFVTVIIPVLNNAPGLGKCLDALDRQGYPQEAYEVLVIDNGSTDNVREVAEAYDQAILLKEDYPSQAAARNKGILAAKGELLAFTDSDCIPALDWIEKGVEHLSREPRADYVGGKITLFFRNPQKPTACELYESAFSFPQKSYIEEKNYSTTANLFTRRSIFDETSLFKRDSYTGSDEEWGHEVHAKGFRQVYADDVEILHPARHTWQQLSLKQARIRLSRYRKARQAKRRSTPWQRLRWLVDSPLLRSLLHRVVNTCSDQRLTGVKQRMSVIYILFRRLCFDYVIRCSVLCGVDLKHDYALLREQAAPSTVRMDDKAP